MTKVASTRIRHELNGPWSSRSLPKINKCLPHSYHNKYQGHCVIKLICKINKKASRWRDFAFSLNQRQVSVENFNAAVATDNNLINDVQNSPCSTTPTMLVNSRPSVNGSVMSVGCKPRSLLSLHEWGCCLVKTLWRLVASASKRLQVGLIRKG